MGAALSQRFLVHTTLPVVSRSTPNKAWAEGDRLRLTRCWLASCDLPGHRTYSLCLPIGAQLEWLHAPFYILATIRCPVACFY